MIADRKQHPSNDGNDIMISSPILHNYTVARLHCLNMRRSVEVYRRSYTSNSTSTNYEYYADIRNIMLVHCIFIIIDHGIVLILISNITSNNDIQI